MKKLQGHSDFPPNQDAQLGWCNVCDAVYLFEEGIKDNWFTNHHTMNLGGWLTLVQCPECDAIEMGLARGMICHPVTPQSVPPLDPNATREEQITSTHTLIGELAGKIDRLFSNSPLDAIAEAVQAEQQYKWPYYLEDQNERIDQCPRECCKRHGKKHPLNRHTDGHSYCKSCGTEYNKVKPKPPVQVSPISCPTCRNYREINGHSPSTCVTCNGMGKLPYPKD